MMQIVMAIAIPMVPDGEEFIEFIFGNFNDIINMKKIIPLLAMACFFANCHSTKQSRNLKHRYISAYAQGFKIELFKTVLDEAYYHSVQIQNILQLDASRGMADMPVTQPDMALIDSLSKRIHQEMLNDSLTGIHKAEGAQGKHILSKALSVYQSSWLNKLAFQRGKIAVGDW